MDKLWFHLEHLEIFLLAHSSVVVNFCKQYVHSIEVKLILRIGQIKALTFICQKHLKRASSFKIDRHQSQKQFDAMLLLEVRQLAGNQQNEH